MAAVAFVSSSSSSCVKSMNDAFKDSKDDVLFVMDTLMVEDTHGRSFCRGSSITFERWVTSSNVKGGDDDGLEIDLQTSECGSVHELGVRSNNECL